MIEVLRTEQIGNYAARKLSHQQRRIMPGVFLPYDRVSRAEPTSLSSRVAAALAICPEGSLISGLGALELMGVDLPDGLNNDGVVTIAIPRASQCRLRRAGVSIQRLRVMPTRWGRSQTLAEPAHCWATAALALAGQDPWLPGRDWIASAPGVFEHPRKVRFLQIIQLGEALTRRSNPVLTQDNFAARIAAWVPRHPGKPLVRELFSHVRCRTDSVAETWLRLAVIDAGFPEPVVNHGVFGPSGWRYLDLSWPDRLIALEYHGRQHFDNPSQSYEDVGRRGELQAAGWTVIEATRRDLRQPGELLRRLGAAFARAER
ncbi:MAG: hypothetical protein LBJ62_10100 [Bifidobacteriaceae bacterium]|jgi:hypothetical protein|nr:hypothetical protein [Bifidobacteriaceae bacterium]